jgi:murein DD-endopeptidase MepM/ murein hydrolase activator NlpD
LVLGGPLAVGVSVVLGSSLVSGCAQPPVVVSGPLGSDIELPLDSRTIVARVVRGSTLGSLLTGHGLADTLVNELVARATDVFDVRKVRVDQPYRIIQSASGFLRRFEYEIDANRLLEIAASDAGALVARIRPIPKTTKVGVVRGQIDREASSLFAAMDRAGEEIDLSLALADVFGSEVDFNTELQPGDRFSLVVEKQFREDQAFGGYGALQVAMLENDGRKLQACRFAPEGAPPAYFDANGVSLRRFFLRSPLKFEPSVSSGFSPRRLHPVLHEYRAHLGVDYRAPVGAPVIAVASGTVVSAGWSGGSGQMVHVRHANGFETQYLHLSSLAVRRGARVEQGETIGRVGSTGLSTAPHLDYRLRKNGVYINPVAAHRAMPPGDPVPASQLPAFEGVRDRALQALQ